MASEMELLRFSLARAGVEPEEFAFKFKGGGGEGRESEVKEGEGVRGLCNGERGIRGVIIERKFSKVFADSVLSISSRSLSLRSSFFLKDAVEFGFGGAGGGPPVK